MLCPARLIPYVLFKDYVLEKVIKPVESSNQDPKLRFSNQQPVTSNKYPESIRLSGIGHLVPLTVLRLV